MSVHKMTEPDENAHYEDFFVIEEKALVDKNKEQNKLHSFQCDMCSKVFKTQYLLTNHSRTHTGERPFQCGICGKAFTTKSHMIRHERIHLDQKPFKCNVCEKTYATKYQVTDHEKKHNKKISEKSENTGLGETSKKGTKLHLPTKTYKCDICGKFWKNADRLKIHLRFHTGEKPFQCDVCGKSFVTRSHVKRHKLIHSEVKPHQCTVCEKTFTFNQQLTVHMRTHTGEKPYQCEICAHPCASLAALRYHKMSHTGEHPYTCSYCGKGFKGRSHLKNHERTHTGEKAPKRIRKKPASKSSAIIARCQCDFCGNVFSNPYNLKLHIMLHTNEKPYQCNICGNAFRIPSTLKEHMMIHSSDRPIKCTGCDKRFFRESDMRSHAKMHNAVKEFQCTLCDKGYPTRKNLRYHMMTHTGEKPFKCNTCGVGFRTRRDVRRHETVHTGKQMYQCDKCDMDFAKRYELQSHMVSLHADELFVAKQTPNNQLSSSHKQNFEQGSLILPRLSAGEESQNSSSNNQEKDVAWSLGRSMEDASPKLSFREKMKAQNSWGFDTMETSEKYGKLHYNEGIPKDKENNFCLIDTNDTAMTLEMESIIERRDQEEIHDSNLQEEGECTNSTSDGYISVGGDTSESEYNTEECSDPTIKKNEYSQGNDETDLFNSYEFLPVIKQEDDEMVDTEHYPSDDRNANDIGNTPNHTLEIEAPLKQENDDKVSNCEDDDTKKDTMNNGENNYHDISWIKQETSEIRVHSSMHAELKSFSILIPKMEKELADLALKADIVHSKNGGNFLSVCKLQTKICSRSRINESHFGRTRFEI